MTSASEPSPALPRITDYVRHYATRWPRREALVLGNIVVTYEQLSGRVDRWAKALLANGICHGDRVATLLPPTPEFFELFLATASIGGIWLGLNPRHTPAEHAYVLGDAQPALVLTRPIIDGRSRLAELRTIASSLATTPRLVALSDERDANGWETRREFLARSACISGAQHDSARARVRSEDPALIVYTSGTTGAPKGALLTHRGLAYCGHVASRYESHRDPYVVINNFPINHVASVGDTCSVALAMGGTIVFMEQFDPAGVLRTIDGRRVTHWGQIPAMLQLELGQLGHVHPTLQSVRVIVWGGNPAPLNLVQRLRAICPNLCNVYGLTETTGNILFVRGTDHDDETMATTIGWPVPEYEVTLRDDDGVVAAGVVGEICARGPYLMAGYWRRPGDTGAAIDGEGWLHTGDLAVQRPDGAFKLVGRLKEMFKSGGYNVYPAEVEQVLNTCPGVAAAIVVSMKDPLYTEVGCAFFVAGQPGASEEVLRRVCRERLANYKIPKRFVQIDVLPMLANGKVDKQSLADRAQNLGSKERQECD